MSESTAPGRPAPHRRRSLLYFWLVIAIGSMWQRRGARGAPGVGLSDIQSWKCQCPNCDRIADRQRDDTFLCPCGHTFILELGPDGSTLRAQDGSLKCDTN
jgi:hypothetical protein